MSFLNIVKYCDNDNLKILKRHYNEVDTAEQASLRRPCCARRRVARPRVRVAVSFLQHKEQVVVS